MGDLEGRADRPHDGGEIAPDARPGGAGENDGALTPVHPNHERALRLSGAIFAPVPLAGVLAADLALPVPPMVLFGPALVLAAFLLWTLPHRRFVARGYAVGADRLRVVRGLLFRYDTVVPFGRVQHIDVDRGPVERYYGLATLTLHTAGSHNASVTLPGLAHETALALREDIRAHIGRETR